MPSPLSSHDFFAHHSPFGAFASFSLGRLGKGGGFGLELAGPARQDVFVALVRPGEGVHAFPFYADASSGGAEAYTGSAEPTPSDTNPLSWHTFTKNEITRTMGWASDTWTAGDLTFRLLTPFGPVADPATLSGNDLKRAVCPAILAEITLRNSHSDTEAFAFFGIGDADPLRPLSDTAGANIRGIARETLWGFAVESAEAWEAGHAEEMLTWGLREAIAAQASPEADVPLNRLANRGGLLLHVGPGETRTFTLALGFYRGGTVTSGIAFSYLYSHLFPDLETVLEFALENADYYRQMASDRDAELDAMTGSGWNDERRFLTAHATHSYHGSTMLLHDGTAPLWVVNEGEYRMLNTFDLTVDHAFWELKWHPWTLRDVLDLFVSRYSYNDEIQDALDPARPVSPGGLSFTHDMGVANVFSPPGYSSYERPDLPGCFSYMTQEQLCNWCLCAALYGLPTRPHPNGDTPWLASRTRTLEACLESLLRRDGPEESRNGVMSFDSLRCASGQEITTYDSLDESLGQARANLYLAVKTWATYLGLARCFATLGDTDRAQRARNQAERAARTVVAAWDEATQSFPAVLEPDNPGWNSRIIPAIEGLAYPALWGDSDSVANEGAFGEMVALLRRHLKTVLVPGTCLDGQSGGWKLSSSATNTWMSKIFLCQYVAEMVLGVASDPACETAHARWQRDGDCRDFAFTDQVASPDGKDLGSRFYPRGVTALLWMGYF